MARQPGEVMDQGFVKDADGRIVAVAAPDVVGDSTVFEGAASTTAVTLAPANAQRRSLKIFNAGKQRLYVKHGAGVSLSSFTVVVPPNWEYELDSPVYLGVVTGVWDGTDGSGHVTEGV